MNPVQKIKIVSTEKLYKDTVEANSIELAYNDTNAFGLVVGKNQDAFGKEGIYIQPDFCLSDLPIFDTYIRPDGNGNKSRLGKNFRIRALKFNFSLEGSIDPVFSMGVFLTRDIFNEYYPNVDFDSVTEEELTSLLGITKYEEPEKGISGQSKGDLPVGMYSTDETNSANIKNHIDKVLPSKVYLTEKVDGSSISIYVKEDGSGICSRNLEKKLDATQLIRYELNDRHYRKHWNPDLQIRGWYNEDTSMFYSDAEMAGNPKAIPVEEPLKDIDTWVKLGMPILERFNQWCKDNNFVGVLRGEINGQGMKGSGNKMNPHASDPQNIRFFGLDDYSTGASIRVPMDTEKITQLCADLDIQWCKIVCEDIFESYDQLVNYCNDYFKTNPIEGIVVRTTDDNQLSAKIMNLEYDSKK